MNKIISFSTGSTALQSADEFADGFVAWWMKFRQIFEVLKEICEIRTVFVHDLWWIGVFMFFFVFFFSKNIYMYLLFTRFVLMRFGSL